ncbi:major Facilitator Superfamily protein [Sphingomonas sp. S17]|uniref:MFS transporter n=2 Tax=Sphingomonas paucimobilis TaxID=13689 RepID=A0A411LGR9_SPHPI|nr:MULTISPECIES: MFS transporter [Sphingomonas]EGI56165.1 major Facilitator Superfamily protein [Sphingomonas sp. S17]MBQ1481386.1 MFS transporter [Sphingomonas sp.]MDG5972244.1 MFS transporter [Sphingomonas paucimobilis]NNG57776.1 MFS transporter [Sphingomonas paucimobilis]QBE91521.1 MFS transporter [Sphingomonas paucimobilis]
MPHPDAGSRLATRIAFFVAGFGLACWAPLVPLTKARLVISDGSLGLLLLCLGLGSVLSMQFAGAFISKLGARPIIIIGGIGQAILLPFLAFAPTVPTMAAALLIFGGFLGLIEVSMNVHAVEVEKRGDKPLMSGFHGLFSVGGFVGSLLLTAILSAGVAPTAGAIGASLLMIVAVLFAAPRLIDTPQADQTPFFAVPRGIVALLAILASITFLTEGAMLDWSALLLTDRGILPTAQAGIGYSVFAVAMTAGRLTGDAVVMRLGNRRTMFWGGILAIIGYIVLLTAPTAALALFGFLLIGLGASNTVPVLFRQAGAQTAMPPGLAIAAITTVGYAGVLIGPAGIGSVAQAIGLPGAFVVLTLMLILVPLCAGAVTRRTV